MRLHLNISQIFIPNHKQATNFVSMYEEVVRADEPVDLLLIVEVRSDRKSSAQKKQADYERLSQTIAHALKRTYSKESKVTEMTFEKALSVINQELSELARNGMVSWYKKLGAVIAVFSKHTLWVATTGSASAYLMRNRTFSQVAEQIEPRKKPNPVKTFDSFTSGKLLEGDHVFLSTAGLFNYLSLERLRQSFGASLSDGARDIITILKQDAPVEEAFASFIAKVTSRPELPDAELMPLMSPASRNIIDDADTLNESGTRRAMRTAGSVASVTGKAASGAAQWIFGQFKKINPSDTVPLPRTVQHVEKKQAASKNPMKKRKTLFISLIVIIFLLVINVIYFNIKNAERKTQTEYQQLLDRADQEVNEAKAALIYNDEKKALEHVNTARELMVQILQSTYFADEVRSLEEDTDALFNQLNKIRVIEEVEELAVLNTTPDQLVPATNGFIAFNSLADTFEQIVFGSTPRTIEFSSPLPGNMSSGFHVPGSTNTDFISSSGRIYALEADSGTWSPASSTTTAENINIVSAGLYLSRLYALDTGGSQIWRYSQTEQSFSEPQGWLTAPSDLSAAIDIAVDGDIYVLLPGSLKKFTRGSGVDFSLPSMSEKITDATRLITASGYQYIYIVEPKTERIIILTKSGQLAVQLTSPEFKNLKDVIVNEVDKTMYVLAGNRLLRFGY